jgi:hypothetical protein
MAGAPPAPWPGWDVSRMWLLPLVEVDDSVLITVSFLR